MGVTERAVLVAAVLAAGCTEPAGEIEIPAADPVAFRDKVYPILLRDCAFPACHGTHERFFAVFGPGRTRLDPMTPIYDPPTSLELELSYDRARSMLVGVHGASDSPFVRKPIPTAQGGAGHRGDDLWGTPVFRTKTDQRYVVLYTWATGKAP